MNALRIAGLALASLSVLGLAHGASAQIPAGGFNFFNFDFANTGGNTTVNGLSNTDSLVGFYTTDGTNFTNFSGKFGALSAITSTPALGTAAQANGINSTNTIMGLDGNDNAFQIKGGTLTTLPPANGANTGAQTAFGVNDKGVIVGQFADTAAGNTPGFVLNGTTFTTVPVPSVTNATTVNVQGINNNGLAVGFYTLSTQINNLNVSHGFLFDSNTNTFTPLADPNVANFVFSQVLGINDQGEAVGYYGDNANNQFGFLYNTKTQKYTFLNDPSAANNNDGFQVTQITGISNSGAIDGFYTDAANVQHGFYATPAAVPEPGSLALVALGALPLAWAARRRKTTSD